MRKLAVQGRHKKVQKAVPVFLYPAYMITPSTPQTRPFLWSYEHMEDSQKTKNENDASVPEIYLSLTAENRRLAQVDHTGAAHLAVEVRILESKN